jgi:uncharacterized protein (DUF3084 family)
VIRHGGAPHLRVAGLDLPWYQYFLLDVIVVVSVATLVVLFVLYQSIKKNIFRLSQAKKAKIELTFAEKRGSFWKKLPMIFSQCLQEKVVQCM